MADISDLLLIVALVTQMKAGSPIGTATGFFYTSGDRLFFVTNRHVVLPEQPSNAPDVLSLLLHTDESDLTKNAPFPIPLYDGAAPSFFGYPNYAKVPVDIVVVPLNMSLRARYVFKAVSKANFLPDSFVLSAGDDAMVVGFPRGLSDSVHNLPIVRAALVSSAPAVHFAGMPFFLIDANLHPGTSGSPVFTRPRSLWPDKQGNTNLLGGTPSYFLGVHSATVFVPLATGSEPLGLATVWYGALIEEIIAAIPAPKAA